MSASVLLPLGASATTVVRTFAVSTEADVEAGVHVIPIAFLIVRCATTSEGATCVAVTSHRVQYDWSARKCKTPPTCFWPKANFCQITATQGIWVRYICIALLLGWQLQKLSLLVLHCHKLLFCLGCLEKSNKPDNQQKNWRKNHVQFGFICGSCNLCYCNC